MRTQENTVLRVLASLPDAIPVTFVEDPRRQEVFKAGEFSPLSNGRYLRRADLRELAKEALDSDMRILRKLLRNDL